MPPRHSGAMNARSRLAVLVLSTLALGLTASGAQAATVTSAADSGAGSLRALVVSGDPSITLPDPTTLASPGSSYVISSPLAVSSNTAIASAGARKVTIDAQQSGQVFQ